MLQERIAESVRALTLAAAISKEQYGQKLVIAYSGGKDSDVMLHVAEQCLAPADFEVVNSHTSVDAPPTVYHIRDVKKRLNANGIDMTVHYPRDEEGKQVNMVKLIAQNKYPPTRTARYCCRVLKETSVPNRVCALGVRAAESTNRKGRDIFATRGRAGKMPSLAAAGFYSIEELEAVIAGKAVLTDEALYEALYAKEGLIVNPLYGWSETEIWQYIRLYNVPVNPLYFPPYNYKRVGCVLCPMASYAEKMKQLADFPGYKRLYLHAFNKMLEARRENGLKNRAGWETAEDVFNWWVEEYKHNVKGQISIEEWLGGDKWMKQK